MARHRTNGSVKFGPSSTDVGPTSANLNSLRPQGRSFCRSCTPGVCAWSVCRECAPGVSAPSLRPECVPIHPAAIHKMRSGLLFRRTRRLLAPWDTWARSPMTGRRKCVAGSGLARFGCTAPGATRNVHRPPERAWRSLLPPNLSGRSKLCARITARRRRKLFFPLAIPAPLQTISMLPLTPDIFDIFLFYRAPGKREIGEGGVK